MIEYNTSPYDQWVSLKTKDPVTYHGFDGLYDFCKATSLYDFNKKVGDPVGDIPNYIPICRFYGEWENDVKQMMAQTEPATFDFRSNPRFDNNNNLEYNDFKKWGYKVDGEDDSYAVLNRIRHADLPESMIKIAELFGFDHPAGKKSKKPNIKFDVQLPGQMFYWHLDNFGGILKEQRDDYNTFAACDHDQRLIMRVIVFLDDQKEGQVWKQGNEYIHWKKGDCITWPWRDIPHGTCNFGHDPRPTLNITGAVTEETYKFLKSCPRIISI
jgi:hypothetical protein